MPRVSIDELNEYIEEETLETYLPYEENNINKRRKRKKERKKLNEKKLELFVKKLKDY